jgi:hypothetical protein
MGTLSQRKSLSGDMGPSPLVLSKKIRTARRCNNFAVPSSSGIRLGGNHKSHCAASPGSQLNRPRWIDPSMLRPLLSAAKEPDENVGTLMTALLAVIVNDSFRGML